MTWDMSWASLATRVCVIVSESAQVAAVRMQISYFEWNLKPREPPPSESHCRIMKTILISDSNCLGWKGYGHF